MKIITELQIRKQNDSRRFGADIFIFRFKIFFLPHRLFHVCRFVTARERDGWWLVLHCPSYDTFPRLPGISELLVMTFRLWPGSPSASEAKSRQWSFWDLTKCLVNYKVTHTGAGHKETFKPPDVFLPASNKADVLDFCKAVCNLFWLCN